MGFTKNNHLMSCIRYANALHAVIIFIGSRDITLDQFHQISNESFHSVGVFSRSCRNSRVKFVVNVTNIFCINNIPIYSLKDFLIATVYKAVTTFLTGAL